MGDDEDVQRAKRDAQRQAAEENAETKLQRQRDRKRRRQVRDKSVTLTRLCKLNETVC